MTHADEGVEYTEIFEVIAKYANMDLNHQVKALSLVADNYTPFGNLPMRKTREIVERVLANNNYQIWFGGRPSLVGLDAVVAVAKWGEEQEWASEVLQRILDSLLNHPYPWEDDPVPSPDKPLYRLDVLKADAMHTVLKAYEEVQSSIIPT